MIRLSPEMIRKTFHGLKSDQKKIIRQMHEQFVRIAGEAAVKKVGYLRTKIGRSDRKCDFLFVPQKHVRED